MDSLHELAVSGWTSVVQNKTNLKFQPFQGDPVRRVHCQAYILYSLILFYSRLPASVHPTLLHCWQRQVYEESFCIFTVVVVRILSKEVLNLLTVLRALSRKAYPSKFICDT